MSEMVRQRGIIKKLSNKDNLMEVFNKLVTEGKIDKTQADIDGDYIGWIAEDEYDVINGCLFDVSDAPELYDDEDFVEEGERLNDTDYKVHLYWYNGGDSPISSIISNADKEYEKKGTPSPRVVFEFKTKEDRDKWYGGYTNSGEQELFEYWYQDNEEVPEWTERVEN